VSHSFAAGALAPGNFLIPNMTFVVELMAFIIVLSVLWRYVIPPVQQAMNARQEMARQLVSDSEEATRLLEQAQTAYKAAMAGARREAAQLRAQAEQQRREIVEGGRGGGRGDHLPWPGPGRGRAAARDPSAEDRVGQPGG
jgi:regulator of protease activity HflC (stomatin/prohibitin superfamily)